MSHNKTQISPIPPDSYGDRFVKFIGGLTKTKEEVEREAHAADQLDGSNTPTHRQPSWSISRTSTDKVIEKAEKQAQKTEREGASEETTKDRTITTARSPSVERASGATGATLPVVQEDAECSQDASFRDEKSESSTLAPQATISAKDSTSVGTSLPNIPPLQRLSLGLNSTAKATTNS